MQHNLAAFYCEDSSIDILFDRIRRKFAKTNATLCALDQKHEQTFQSSRCCRVLTE